MGLVEKIYTKIDNGSLSEWEEWDGQLCEHKRLYAAGWGYCRAHKLKTKWKLVYRLGTFDLTLPDVFNKLLKDEAALVTAINTFAEWAFKNQIKIIGAQQRECE